MRDVTRVRPGLRLLRRAGFPRSVKLSSEYKPLGNVPLPKAAALGTAMLIAQQNIKLVEHEVKGETEHAHQSSFPSQLRRAGCMHATSLKITKWTEN